MKDPYGNLFQLEQDDYVFIDEKKVTGGANGAIIGVSDIDRSLPFYTQLLEYDKVVFDQTGLFSDLEAIEGGKGMLRRVILERSKPIEGPLSRIMGASHLELIQTPTATSPMWKTLTAPLSSSSRPTKSLSRRSSGFTSTSPTKTTISP